MIYSEPGVVTLTQEFIVENVSLVTIERWHFALLIFWTKPDMDLS